MVEEIHFFLFQLWNSSSESCSRTSSFHLHECVEPQGAALIQEGPVTGGPRLADSFMGVQKPRICSHWSPQNTSSRCFGALFRTETGPSSLQPQTNKASLKTGSCSHVLMRWLGSKKASLERLTLLHPPQEQRNVFVFSSLQEQS